MKEIIDERWENRITSHPNIYTIQYNFFLIANRKKISSFKDICHPLETNCQF